MRRLAGSGIYGTVSTLPVSGYEAWQVVYGVPDAGLGILGPRPITRWASSVQPYARGL